jgi:hypothetical protein
MCDASTDRKTSIDHCGPKIKGFKSWLISFLVPDDLWGVYIGDICRVHDEDYSRGGDESDRLAADERFRDSLYIRLNTILMNQSEKQIHRKALLGSKLYYFGVRSGGSAYFNYTKETT